MVQIKKSKQDDAINEARQLVNILLSNAYEAEWQRTHDLESKACSSVGFTGIIFTLMIGTFSSFLVSTDASIKEKIFFSSIISIIIVFLILSLMVLSMFFGIMALSVKNWKFPEAKKIIDIYKEGSNGAELKKELLSSMNETYYSCIDINDKLNSEVALYVKCSHICFLLSIILIVVYFIYILEIFF